MNMAAIFKNGGYECRISQNAPYLKLEDQKMYILSQKETFYVKMFMKYGKASFLFSMAAILNIAKKWWKHQNLRLLPSKFWNSMTWRSSVPNFMLLSRCENLWPFLTLRAPTTKRVHERRMTSNTVSRIHSAKRRFLQMLNVAQSNWPCVVYNLSEYC